MTTEAMIAFPLPGGGRCLLVGPLSREAVEHALTLLALQRRAFPPPPEPARDDPPREDADARD